MDKSAAEQLREEGFKKAYNHVCEEVAKNMVLSAIDWEVISSVLGFSVEKLKSIKDTLTDEEKKELQEKLDNRAKINKELEKEVDQLIEVMKTSNLKQRSKKTRKKLISILERYLANYDWLDLWKKTHIQNAITCMIWHWYKLAAYDIKLIFKAKNEIPEQFIYNEAKKDPLRQLSISDLKNALHALSFEWWR